MTPNFAQMIDPGALTIVLTGTAIATVARCGWHDLRQTARALAGLGRSTFDEDANRVALAKTVREIEARGPLCADVSLPPDPSLARGIKTYLRHSSLEEMHAVRRAERASREVARNAAARTFEYAGELAPVFGLVGTLFAITQLVPAEGDVVENTMGAIATAVLSTLYGVLTAHTLCIPLARAIERQGEREETERGELVDWFEGQMRNSATARLHPLKGAA